jgi:predicted TIM-barrel fold metal-dependent hydrolase
VFVRHVRELAAVVIAFGATACAHVGPPRPLTPRVDYHQHLVSAAFSPIAQLPERNGAALVRELDASGIDRAVVLSVGYSFADERKALSDPDGLTRAENDWTSAEVVENAPRLVGFCSANPLREAALQELDRCLALPGMVGIKVHMGNSGVTLRDLSHLSKLRQLFALAQRRSAPILVHMRARGGLNFGAKDARLFVDELLPVAHSVEVLVAHLGGAGPGYPSQNDEVLEVLAQAAQRRDPRVRHLYVDVATNVTSDTSPEDGALIARRIRSLGVSRVLYGSDLSPPGGSISAGWEIFRRKIPLTNAELRRIARNRTAFLR